jgi:zinc transport system substrate-binding protein
MKYIGKRISVLLLCLTLLLSATAVFAGCDTPKNPTTADNNGITIICTNFAAFDFTRSMLAYYTENGGTGVVELMILGKPGQDMHSFEPTAQDIISLANADVVVCTGAESWLDAALKSSGNTVARVISMMEVCDTVQSEHDHDHDHDHGGEDCALIGQDEHVWLSFFNANRICFAISEALRKADEENKDIWHSAFLQYANDLGALEGEYHNMMNSAVRNKVVVADRHPFVYLFHDLNLTCLAAFPGCSSETSASFETQAKLIEYTKKWELLYIFVMEGSDGKVARVVADETGAEILTLNSLQVVTDYENTTYISAMRQNLENLKKALQ